VTQELIEKFKSKVLTIGWKPLLEHVPFVRKPIRDFNLKQAVMKCVAGKVEEKVTTKPVAPTPAVQF
jgi:hypothetical protein